jgi:hypothetical protein
MILPNPRYTGRQVWNKQRKDEVLIDVEDVASGHATKMQWNEPRQVDLVQPASALADRVRTHPGAGGALLPPPDPLPFLQRRPAPDAVEGLVRPGELQALAPDGAASADLLRLGDLDDRTTGRRNREEKFGIGA